VLVVGGDDERARPVVQHAVQDLQRCDVEVVGRVVEQQARRTSLGEDGELRARALGGRERAGRTFRAVGAEAEER
jgi:hypothetical protein